MEENNKPITPPEKAQARSGKGGENDGAGCTHRDQVRDVTPASEGCAKCLAKGDTWVHLRLCLICGHVGCCDNSINRHATRHFQETGHPLIQSFEPEEDWRWCYVDRAMLCRG